MHYVIVDFTVRENAGGVLSILRDVYDYALNNKTDSFTFIVGSEKLISARENVRVIERHDLQTHYIKRVAFDFFCGAKFIDELNPDIVISLQNTAILRLKVPEMVYVHQPLPFEKDYNFSFLNPRERKMAFYQKIVGFIIKLNLRLFRHGAVTVQTKWLRREIGKYTRLEIFVNKPSFQIKLADSRNAEEFQNCFFFPSTAMVYKNHNKLVAAYLRLPTDIQEQHKLCLTITKEEYESLFGDIKPDKNIAFLGRISRSRVLSILSHSILVFPSRIETLGLPIMEAMSLKRPIAASRIDAVMEVSQGYDRVRYFDVDDVESIEHALLAVANLPASKVGYSNRQEDSWDAFFKNVEGLV